MRRWLASAVSAAVLVVSACAGDDTGSERASSDDTSTGGGGGPAVRPTTPPEGSRTSTAAGSGVGTGAAAGGGPGSGNAGQGSASSGTGASPTIARPTPGGAPVTVTTASGLSPLPAAAPTSSTVAAPPTTTGLPPGTVETVIGRSKLRFADPPGTTANERPMVDAYHRFLRGLLASADPPDPDNGDLAATMSPDYLAKERERLRLMRDSGQLAFGDYESNPRLVRPIAGDVVRIEDCALDSGARFSTSGEVLRPATSSYGRTVAELDRSSGSWRVRSWNATGQACSP
jgi:hypothetical protein